MRPVVLVVLSLTPSRITGNASIHINLLLLSPSDKMTNFQTSKVSIFW